MASIEKLVKAFEALKIPHLPQIVIPDVATGDDKSEKQKKKDPLSKKDQIAHCNIIADGICTHSLRSNPDFPKFLGIALETFLACCDSPDADVRMVADECLNRTIKTHLETNLGRLQVELYKEIKKNGSSRCLRAALWRFADLIHLIRPQKCRPYMVNLLPCIARISKRTEDSVQETLAASMAKIFPVLGKFSNDSEVKVLLKSFLPNLKSNSAVCRRTAASCLTTICVHSRKPTTFFSWLLTMLLDMVIPVRDESTLHPILGVLLCMRHIISHLAQSETPEEKQNLFQGNVGKLPKEQASRYSTDQLVQIYEFLLFCTQNSNHNVVTASLETLQQLLKSPPPSLLSILLTPSGMTASQIMTREQIQRSRSGSSASLLPSLPDEESLLEDETPEDSAPRLGSEEDSAVGTSLSPEGSVDFTLSPSDPEQDMSLLSEVSAGANTEDDEYSSMEIGYCQDSPLTDLPARVTDLPLGVLKRVVTLSQEELSVEGGDDDIATSRGTSPNFTSPTTQVEFRAGNIGSFGDDQVPLAFCVRHLSSLFLLTGYPGATCPDRHVRVSVKSLALSCIGAAVSLYPDAFYQTLYIHETDEVQDPQLSGNTALLIGNLLCAQLTASHLTAFQTKIGKTSVESLVKYLLLVLNQDSSVAIRHTLVALGSCLPLLFNSIYSQQGLKIARELLPLVNNSYWLVKVELVEVLSNIDYSIISYIEASENSFFLSRPVPYQEKVLHDVMIPVLGDEDARVRQAAATAIVKLVPRLFNPVDCPEHDPITTKARDLTCEYLNSLMLDVDSSLHSSVHGLAGPYDLNGGTTYSTGLESSLSRVVHALMQSLIQSSSKYQTFGCINALWLLSEEYRVPKFSAAWSCSTTFVSSTQDELSINAKHNSANQAMRTGLSGKDAAKIPLLEMGSGASGGPLGLILNVLVSTTALLDLAVHQQALRLAGNLFAGAAYKFMKLEEDRLDSEPWCMLDDRIVAGYADQLLLHLARLLSICMHVIEGITPGPPSTKPALPSLPNPPSLSPIKRKTTKKDKDEKDKEKEKEKEKDSGQKVKDGEKATEKSETPKEKKEEKEKQQKQTVGSFYNIPCYMNLHDVMKGAFSNYKVSLELNAIDRFGSMLKATLDTLSTLLEIAGIKEMGKVAEELLTYLKTTVGVEPTATVVCVQQLLKSLFGTNLSSHWSTGLQVNPSRKPGKVTRLLSVKPGLYHCCFTAPYTQFTQNLMMSGSRSPGQNDGNVSPDWLGWMKHKLHKKMPTVFKPGNREKAGPIASYIRLFEPLVIKALKLYTITSSIDLQIQVLDLLAQLVQLRVNYCLLDSDQIFIGFVIRQFEYIEEGQIKNSEKLISHIFHFLVLLSYERYHSKSIIGMPKIIQLCDGLMASGQSPVTHAIPALQPIVVDLFAARGTVTKADAGKELETQREVVVSMLLRLIQFYEVMDLFTLVLHHCHKDEEDKWKRLSRQIVDILLPLLANFEINLDDQGALDVLHRLFESVAPSVFRPVDILLNVLLGRPKPLLTVQRLQRWTCLVLAILRVLICQAKEEIVLSRLQELGLLVSIHTDTLKVQEYVNDEARLVIRPAEETLARFLIQVIGMLSEKISHHGSTPAATQYENCSFLSQQLAHLLLYVMHMFQSGIYRRVATATMTVIRDEPPNFYYSVMQINTHFWQLRMTYPTLLLQWCNILTLLNYDDQPWWSELMQTRRLITSPQQVVPSQPVIEGPLSWSLELVRRGGLVLFCDFVCENLNDAEQMTWLIVNHVNDLIELYEEPPVQDFISAIHRNSAASGLFIQAIHSRCDNLGTPLIVRKTLKSLDAIHPTQSGPLVALLIDRILCTHHVSVARMCDTITCHRLEMLLAENARHCAEQLPLDDLDKLIDTMKTRGLVKRHARLMSLLAKVHEVLCSQPRQILSPEKSHPLSTNPLPVIDINVDKEWLLSIAVEQCCRSDVVPVECAKLLANLEFSDMLSTMKLLNFNLSVLEASMALGVKKTLSCLYAIQDVTSPSEQIHPSTNLDTKEHSLYKAAHVALLELINGVICRLPSPHQVPLFASKLEGSRVERFMIKLEALLADKAAWSFVFELAPVLNRYLESCHLLPWESNICEEAASNVCRFGVLLLECLHWKLASGKHISATQLQTALDCFALILSVRKLFAVLSLDAYASFVISSVNSIHHLVIVGTGKSQPCFSGSHESPNMLACSQIVDMLEWLEKSASLSESFRHHSHFPHYVLEPIKRIIIGLARIPLVTSHARLPPLVWSMGWVPVTSTTALPPLPTEYLQDRDVLQQFIFRINALGFTSRQQFEETWMTLLGVLSNTPEEISHPEELERVHVSCLVVRGVTSLLLQCLLHPQPGDTVSGYFLHRQRDKLPGFLHTKTGKRLMKVRGVVQTEIEQLMNSNGCSKKRSLEAFERIFCNNIEREDDSMSFSFGQVSVESVMSKMGLLEEDTERFPAVQSLAELSVDVRSCLQFLLDNLYSMWMKPTANTHIALLSETARSVVLLSDIFTEQTQYEWLAETFLDLYKNHPVEDEILLQYLVVGICKSISVIGFLDSTWSDRVSKMLEITIHSTHLPTRIATFHGVLYLLESNQSDLSSTVVQFVMENIMRQIACVAAGTVYSEKYVLVMLAVLFYILENFKHDIKEVEFIAKSLQLCRKVASASEDKTPQLVYTSILHGLERLVLTEVMSGVEREMVVKLAVDRLKAHCPLRALAGLGLLLSCMYSEGRMNQDSYSSDSSDSVSPVLEIKDPEYLIVAMERLTILFDR